MTQLTAFVMAAGHGTRMKSSLPKVLHPACGRPLVYYPVKAAIEAGATRVIVIVNPSTSEPVRAALDPLFPPGVLQYAIQEVPRGTGDAVRAGLRVFGDAEDAEVLILSGDTPLLTAEDLLPVVRAVAQGDLLSLLAFSLEDPRGYGRVLRDAQGKPREIREHRDLRGEAEQAVREVNAGLYAVRTEELRLALASLSSDNAQGEFYLTDIVRAIALRGPVSVQQVKPTAALGVNHRGELHDVEEILHARIREHWAREGVSIIGRPLIDESVLLEPDAIVEDGVRLRGKTKIGARTRVDVGVVIDDTQVGADARIKPYSVLSESQVGDGVQLGPFAHLRPGSVLEDEVHVGNFVETKNSRLRRGAKANHLAYLGEADIGERANLGAGTIVCNYDGFQKQKTVVGARAFVGSDSQLIAPVTIGEDAYVATGTTVTHDVPPGALAVGRTRQHNKLDYAEPLRTRLRAAAEAVRAKKG